MSDIGMRSCVVRFEGRFRNNVLWHAIFDTYASVRSFCYETLSAYPHADIWVGALLNLKISPYVGGDAGLRESRWSARALRLSAVLKILPDDLFPRELYSGFVPARVVAEVSFDRLLRSDITAHLRLPPSQIESVARNEARVGLGQCLRTLTPREELVLRQRFGLDDSTERTVADIARDLRISETRVGQIEAKALRKCRHPSRLRLLAPFRDLVC